jgi:nanoRNase/pAp phosphatase (c-di-AMP/oligoRNAs hydrolase)
MALNQTQQVYEAIERAKSPLVISRRNWDPDAITAGLGVLKLIERLEKKPHFVCEDFEPQKNLNFLPHIEHVRPKMDNLNKLVIKVDTSKIKLQDLSYDLKNNFLEIYLAPQNGVWSDNDLKTQTTDYKYDLVIAVGTPDLESLGSIYEKNADFFYRTPIINIDANPANEHFGQINHVDMTATSNSEIVYKILENINRNFIDEDLATLLLAGMITKTRSFKAANVTPQTLVAASHLISLGARREEIIHNFYRTRSIQTLKLWGRVLARIKADETAGLVWSVLTRDDFIHSGSKPDDIEDVIDELIATSPKARATLILYEYNERLWGILKTEKPLSAKDLARFWQPQGEDSQVKFEITGINLHQADKEVVEKIKNNLKQIIK